MKNFNPGLVTDPPKNGVIIKRPFLVFKAASHMLVIGYGQAPPQCLYDMWVTIWSMITGCITFALMIAEITSVIQSMNSSASAYKEKVQQVKVLHFP